MSDEEIYFAIRSDSVDMLQLLLAKPAAQGSTQQLNLNEVLVLACEKIENRQIVDMLLEQPNVDPTFNDKVPIYKARSNDCLPIAQRLLELCPKFNPLAQNNAVISASKKGHLEIVKLLVKHEADPAANENELLFKAALWDKLNVLEFFLAFPSVTLDAKILKRHPINPCNYW